MSLAPPRPPSGRGPSGGPPPAPFLHGFFSGFVLSTFLLLTILSYHRAPFPPSWSTKGCLLPFRPWAAPLSRIDVVVELTAHTTHIHLPFLFYLLTHSASLTVNMIFLNEAVEWANNSFGSLDIFMYDDPLDDLLQGLVGLAWAVAFARCWGWDTNLLASCPGARSRLALIAYGCLYAGCCSCAMASAWFVPRTLGLSLYAVLSCLLTYPLLLLLPEEALAGGRGGQLRVMAAASAGFGGVMAGTSEMVSQNLCCVLYFAATCAAGAWGGGVRGADRFAAVAGLVLAAVAVKEADKYVRGDVGDVIYYYPSPWGWGGRREEAEL
ncbi:hypothetical protein TeGR_g985 [Tetraparma gracilis]|uniref:Peptidase S54 rhomboid domain-containing protein n=1 Tax=Tetraparma gracilis TaxID=2962635 RepID=A0ABQ6MGD5_9STRA|nr:hypothetical protein TeGR_g985 [Tetraparma gracilis]